MFLITIYYYINSYKIRLSDHLSRERNGAFIEIIYSKKYRQNIFTIVFINSMQIANLYINETKEQLSVLLNINNLHKQ